MKRNGLILKRQRSIFIEYIFVSNFSIFEIFHWNNSRYSWKKKRENSSYKQWNGTAWFWNGTKKYIHRVYIRFEFFEITYLKYFIEIIRDIPGKRKEKTRLINNETEPLDSETGQRSIFIEYIFVSNFSKLHIWNISLK